MTSTEKKLRAEWRRIRAEHPERLAGCSFKINARFRRRLGVCRTSVKTGLPVSVEIAKGLTLRPELEAQAFDTLYHEVAHALVGHAAGHGPAWRAMCRKLGAEPSRLAALTTEERQALAVVNPPKWSVRCEAGCGGGQRHRLNKQAACRCGSTLLWTDNQTGRRVRTGYTPFVW